MTVLSVVQDATLKIGVARPDVVFGNTAREAQELASMVNDCACMVAFDTGHDWTALKTLATITGDGSKASFPLPTDYRRMLKTATLWQSATPYVPLTHILDTDEWLGAQVQKFGSIGGVWTLIGDEIHIRDGGSVSPLQTGNQVSYFYLTKNIIRGDGGGLKSAFTADSDTFRLDERLLRLALIWRWKAEKQQDYAEELADYENVLSERIGADKGSRILSVGRRRVPVSAGIAYPGVLG